MKAQSQGQRPNSSHIPTNLLTGRTFLNSLHSQVNSWIKAIQVVTKLTRDVSSGKALGSQEVNIKPREGVGGHTGGVEKRGGGIDLYKDILRAVEGLLTC